ncbi:TonB-dependent receptor [Hymenobacter sp. BT770]|uniref:TonB-dependent receptor n=1 Tax=Hymenobacter sp. BT770 TaxID=2886942 RepID=UPI001D0F952F|nr:TonB-dependent receptor [Hymenobacter sp. BT770]MCC3152032.1 TonB-dependent receptor [Hymenobacter sp. BT770]MDO3415285.1 TonB-dependent receptor [Hymenobacter sp. BT770]
MRGLVLPLFISAALLPAVGIPQVSAQVVPSAQRQVVTGTVTGRVQLADGQDADHVAVRVKGTNRGTSPVADGSFRLDAPVGWQTLTISCLGCAAQEVMVEVKANEVAVVPPVNLTQDNKELDEVTVTATRSFNERPSSIGKLPVRPIDLPQSVTTVGRQVLEQQQALRLSDVLTNVSGVYVMGATGGTQEEIASRGFAYTSANTFKNGVRFNNGVMPEVSSLERMEVLKGSAAILYGNVAAGGVLNIVTKKPQFERGGSVGLRVGSFGFVKPMFDVYGAVGQSNKVAFRLNGTYEQANSFRDVVQSDRVYVNPSLLFRLSPKTNLVLEGDYLRDNRTPDFGIGAIDYQIQESRTRFLNTPDARNTTQQISATATLTSRLSDIWQVRAVGGFQRYDNQLRSATRPNTFAAVSSQSARYGDLGRSLQRTATTENYFVAQLDLTGTFNTGAVGHTLLLGADADQYNTNALMYISQPFDSINIFDRAKALRRPAKAVSGYDALRYNTRTLGNTRRAGFYVQDLISIVDKVKLLAGVRWSYQETPSDVYTYPGLDAKTADVKVTESRRFDSAFSPRLGLVYQPIKTSAVFASYSNSFTPNTGVDVSGQALPPSLIDQYEVGVKNDLFRGALSANVTAYRIVNNNQAQAILPATANNAQELAGQVTSKGVEVDVQSKPVRGWSIITGYSYNYTAYTRSTLYAEGSRLRYNPAHTANASVFYNFGQNPATSGFLKGLSAGVTSYYVGDRLAGRNPRLLNPATGQPFPNGDVNKYIAVPNYLLFDASVGYAYRNFQLRLKMANILDELSYNLHDDNSVNPIAPRNFSATLSYKL